MTRCVSLRIGTTVPGRCEMLPAGGNRMSGRGVFEKTVLADQFFCKPKTTLKKGINLKHKETKSCLVSGTVKPVTQTFPA